MSKSYYDCPECGGALPVFGSNRRNADHKAASMQKAGVLCDDCGQKRRDREYLRDQAEAEKNGWAPLCGSERQIKWAVSIRAHLMREMEDQLERSKSGRTPYADTESLAESVNRCADEIREWLKSEASAAWWIDRRAGNWIAIFTEIVSKISADRIPGATPATVNAIIPPDVEECMVIEIASSNEEVAVVTPAPDDRAKEILKAAGFGWRPEKRPANVRADDFKWRRPVAPGCVPALEILVATARSLLDAGFGVQPSNVAERDAILHEKIAPEHKRWAFVEGGHIVLHELSKSEEIEVRQVRGAKIDYYRRVILPLRYSYEALDFAEKFGLRVTDDLAQLAEERSRMLAQEAAVYKPVEMASAIKSSRVEPGDIHPDLIDE